MNSCPHCGKAVFRPSKDKKKLKAKTSMLVLHKGGEVEINCGSCGYGILLPLSADEGTPKLRKAVEPRLMITKT